ncbi:MAG TPA: hypothetical protein DIW47_13440 [Bacteroidetes bacterium]|nr:hypothetical protein [Bacteroidota bacterium]
MGDMTQDTCFLPSPPIDYTTVDTQRTSGDRQYLDSAHYHIIRGKYISGAKFIESYENKRIKLVSWKEYYENGHLKKQGTMTSAIHIPIGIWTYYSSEGGVDSVVNYDRPYRVSYFKALKIAEKKGFKMPDIEIKLKTDSTFIYWEIARWTMNESDATAEVILIDTETGKVTKPEYQLIGIY